MSYSVDDVKKISDELNILVEKHGFDDKCAFSYSDVVKAVNRLHNGKGDSYKGLMSEHIKL